MQTFLPYPDFDRSAEVLDTPRLGKQRVETLQVLRALELPEYGWANHPAVRMWRGRTPALVGYGLACVRAWRRRGHADATDTLIAEFAPEHAGAGQEELAAAGLLPHWLGDDAFHLSHRSALVRKDPQLYRPVFGDVPDDLPYLWPDPDPGAPVAGPVQRDLWVVRAPTPGWRVLFLTAGFVGLDDRSGITVDAGTTDRAGLRALLRELAPQRRPGKDLRQLEALVHEVEPGDRIACLLEGERELAVGEVAGPYRFAPGRARTGTGAGPGTDRSGPGSEVWVPHVRAVRWDGTLPRAAVHPPATLQDPRSLFRVSAPPSPAPGRTAAAPGAGPPPAAPPG